MHLGFGPDERIGVCVIGFDEGIDVLSELLDRGEGSAVKRLALQDREPDFDLVDHTERGDYFRTSASFAASISVRASVVPNQVGDL
jgi:hypothetical protein